MAFRNRKEGHILYICADNSFSRGGHLKKLGHLSISVGIAGTVSRLKTLTSGEGAGPKPKK